MRIHVPCPCSLRFARDENHRDFFRLRIIAQKFVQHKTVDILHHHIADDQVRNFLLRNLKGSGAIFGFDDGESFLTQNYSLECTNLVVIIND